MIQFSLLALSTSLPSAVSALVVLNQAAIFKYADDLDIVHKEVLQFSSPVYQKRRRKRCYCGKFTG